MYKRQAWQTALKFFEEYVKRNFDPEEDVAFTIPFPGIPDDADAGIESGFLELTSNEVQDVFRPIIADVITLVEGQVSQLKALDKSVNGLILVGGFGQSECLLKCLKNRFATTSGGPGMPPGLEVLQPAHAWTAVVRGAVLRGLEGAEVVTNRKARRHYGVECWEPYNSRIHPASSKKWDDLEQCWRAEKRMMWVIKKGDTLSSTAPILVSFYASFTENQTKTMDVELIVCNEDKAPAGLSRGRKSTTKTLCTADVNLQGVPARLWSVRVNPTGLRYHVLTFQIGMQVESGSLRFDVRVDGVVYGEVFAKFE